MPGGTHTVWAVLVALMPKPTGGQRPIALTAMLFRVWSRARLSAISSWQSGAAKFWDAAIKGSSALQAGLVRLLRAESSTAIGHTVGTCLWGMEKFYDGLEFNHVIAEAMRLEYPVLPLGLAMQVHTVPRYLRTVGTLSSARRHANGVLAWGHAVQRPGQARPLRCV